MKRCFIRRITNDELGELDFALLKPYLLGEVISCRLVERDNRVVDYPATVTRNLELTQTMQTPGSTSKQI